MSNQIETAQTPARPQAPGGGGWAAPFGAGALYLVFCYVAPRVRTNSTGAMLVSTILSLALVICFAALLARQLRTPRTILVSGILAAVIAIPLRVLLISGSPMAFGLHARVPGLLDILFIWLAVSLGAALSRILRGANLIPPVAAVLALVDVWTVMLGGPVQHLMQSSHPAAQAVTRFATVQLPSPRPHGAAPMSAVVGFADFLFVAFFVAAMYRLAPGGATFRRTVVGLVVVLCAYMLVVFQTGWALPALLPMAITMIALHWRHFHYDRSEAFALLYAAVFIVLILAGFWYYSSRLTPPPHDGPPGESAESAAMAEMVLAPTCC